MKRRLPNDLETAGTENFHKAELSHPAIQFIQAALSIRFCSALLIKMGRGQDWHPDPSRNSYL